MPGAKQTKRQVFLDLKYRKPSIFGQEFYFKNAFVRSLLRHTFYHYQKHHHKSKIRSEVNTRPFHCTIFMSVSPMEGCPRQCSRFLSEAPSEVWPYCSYRTKHCGYLRPNGHTNYLWNQQQVPQSELSRKVRVRIETNCSVSLRSMTHSTPCMKTK